MGRKGTVTLGDLRGRPPMLELRCARCGRFGRLRLARLISEHGPDMGLPHLVEILSADCPRRQNPNIYDRCDPLFTNVPRPTVGQRS